MQLHWHTEPLLLITLLLFGWLYAIAIGPLRSAIDPNARFSLSRGISFYLGLIITYLAVGSPLDQIGEQFLFSAHMIQHMLLIYITPTLFFVGIPKERFENFAFDWKSLFFSGFLFVTDDTTAKTNSVALLSDANIIYLKAGDGTKPGAVGSNVNIICRAANTYFVKGNILSTVDGASGSAQSAAI